MNPVSPEAPASPERSRIIPRDIRFGIGKAAKRHWLGGCVFKTAIVDCFSLLLPAGERFFIKSIKYYAPQVEDPTLLAAMRDFYLQEAYHTREHEDYNASLTAMGYPAAEMEEWAVRSLRRQSYPLTCLAITAAIEHVTATMSTVLIRNPHLLEQAPEAYRDLWRWHALEELEHKAVALDVFNVVTAHHSPFRRYWRRVSNMNGVLVLFLASLLRNGAVYARADGVRTGGLFWLRLLWAMWINPGFIGRGLGYLLRYYVPGYHPDKVDDEALVARARAWLSRRAAASQAASG